MQIFLNGRVLAGVDLMYNMSMSNGENCLAGYSITQCGKL